MYQRDTVKMERITPKKATDFLACNTYEGQRRMSDSWVVELAEKMEDGSFRTGEIALARIGKGPYVKMNGQHQCNAVILSGIPIMAKVERFTCEDERDMAKLFREYDGHRIRSIGDCVYAEAQAHGIDWPGKLPQLIVAAAAILEGSTHKTKGKKVELLVPYRKHGERVVQIIVGADEGTWKNSTAHIRRKPVVAAMLLTIKQDTKDATDFWTKVRNGELLKRTDPEFKLREFLLTSVSRRTESPAVGYKIVTDHEFMHRCISLWNQHRKRKEAKNMPRYSASSEIPKVL